MFYDRISTLLIQQVTFNGDIIIFKNTILYDKKKQIPNNITHRVFPIHACVRYTKSIRYFSNS